MSASHQTHDTPSEKYNVGDFVLLSNDREGIVCYVGSLDGNAADVIFYGIELLNGSVGDSDGTYANQRYFQTLPQRAIFVTVDTIRRVMIGKDYHSPHRLDRKQSLQSRASILDLVKQSEYELAIYDVAEEVETKCDILDACDMDPQTTSPPLPGKVTQLTAAYSMPLPKKKKKKKKRGRSRSRGKSDVKRRYEQNAKNIDNERNKRLEQTKKRKSFNRVKLDKSIKTAAISGFKNKLKKQTQKEKMFKNEEEAIKHAAPMIEELGFLKYLKDLPAYSRLFKTSKKGKKRKKRKQSVSQKTTDTQSVVSAHVFTQPVSAAAAPAKKTTTHRIQNGKMDHSAVMNKVMMAQKRRKKRKRKKLQFDDEGRMISESNQSKSEGNYVIAVPPVYTMNSDGYKEETGTTTASIERDVMEVQAIENEYDVLDMNNTNTLNVLSETKCAILQNVICEVLRSMSTLQVIEMCNCGLEDKFLSKICKALMDCNHNIWCLNIQSNPIGDDGMLSLAQLIKHNTPCLIHIKLQNNRNIISTEACEEMCTALEMNEYITVFEFEFRHYQYRDKCKRVLRRNNERARKLRLNKKN